MGLRVALHTVSRDFIAAQSCLRMSRIDVEVSTEGQVVRLSLGNDPDIIKFCELQRAVEDAAPDLISSGYQLTYADDECDSNTV